MNISRTLLCAGACMFSASAFAASYKVEIQNLTQGIYFAPLLVATQNSAVSLFQAGMPASSNLQRLAEGGDISGYSTELTAAGAMPYKTPLTAC